MTRKSSRYAGAPERDLSDVPLATSKALMPIFAAVGLHETAMLAVAAAIAVAYQKLGVEVLRRAWVNLEFIWIVALVITGETALVLNLWPSLAG
jgi:hypothetical protein